MHKCENMDHYEAWEEKASLLKVISSNALLEKKQMITLNNLIKTINRLTLWLCSGQIDPRKIFFFPKILVNVIALDSNSLTLCT